MMAPPASLTPADLALARQAWAHVDLAAIRANLDLARRLIPEPTQLMAVVKAGGYGHGMLEVARTALAWGCTWLGVGNLGEGLALRQAGIDAPCLVMAPVQAAEADLYLRHNLVPSVTTAEAAAALSAAAAVLPGRAESGAAVPVHLLVDCGLGRFGVRPAAVAGLGRVVADLPGLELQGLYTHFGNPTDKRRTRAELSRFRRAEAALEAATGAVPLVHAAGSEAAVLVPESRLDLVRLGNLMYGYWAGPRSSAPLVDGHAPRQAWTLRARVIEVRNFARVETLGYGGFRARRRMRVAVLPAGVADGISLRAVQPGAGLRPVLETLLKEVAKSLVRRWRPHVVFSGGYRAPIVGRVGMQFTLVDITEVGGIAVGDEAVVPGVRATACSSLPRVYSG